MNQTRQLFYRLGWLLVVILLVIGIYVAVNTLHTLHTTSLLHIVVDDKQASVTITQKNHSASFIGTGSSDVRLQPGTYLVNATHNGKSANIVTVVSANKTNTATLIMGKHYTVPSYKNIIFTGSEALVTNGLTTDQVTVLKQLFFTYSNTIQSVKIDVTSIFPTPPDDNGQTNMGFSVVIDNVPYRAIIKYSDLDSIELVLTNQAGTKVFDQQSSTNPTNLGE